MLEFALDGLDGGARLRAEAHLAICAHCREMVRQSMELQDGLALLAPDGPEPEGLVASILNRVRDEGR